VSVSVETTRAPLPAHRVDGPAAVTRGDWRRFVHLTVTLALMDWKLRFFGSALGYVWSLLRPLMLFGILYFVFSRVLRVGGDVPYYPLQLLIGVVLFTYFSEVTTLAITSLVDEETLVRKVSFPRMVIPVSVALTASFTLALNLVTVVAFIVFSGVEPRWSWVFVPIPLVLVVVLGTGVGMLLSALYVSFRDVKPIWEVVLQALFYVTPVFYPVQLLLSYNLTLAHIVMCNPIAPLVQETRHFILGNAAPSAGAAIGGVPRLIIPLALLLGISALGFAVFYRVAPRVAEEL
jgi:ABC-2 type transport system permease protein